MHLLLSHISALSMCLQSEIIRENENKKYKIVSMYSTPPASRASLELIAHSNRKRHSRVIVANSSRSKMAIPVPVSLQQNPAQRATRHAGSHDEGRPMLCMHGCIAESISSCPALIRPQF